ncbi:MAG: response regulator [Burkholderiales bacterium]|nr:response regulator [Burkholderiales bacterium]
MTAVAARPKHWRWYLLLVVAGVALAVGVAWRAVVKLDHFLWATSGSQEPYYWAIAQVQIGALNLKMTLRDISSSNKVDRSELGLHADVLASRIRLLTQPSEMSDSFQAVPGFKEYSAALASFGSSSLPLADKEDFGPRDAKILEEELDKLAPAIRELSNNAWFQDNFDREEMLQMLGRRRAVLGGLFVLLCAALIAVMISWTRYRFVALARERALDAEKRAVEEKTQFLGMVSHELRSPLQSIVSALDVLESKRALAEHADVMKSIRRSANELAVQLRDILTLARGETGRIELRPKVFEACELVEETVENVRREAQAKGLDFHVETPAEPIFLVADSVRIGQVVHNLVGNAVKYTERGTVSVTLMDGGVGTDSFRMRIVDSGPGLPTRAMLTVTKGLDAAPALFGERRGIGLAVVRALLLQLGGEIAVSETPGGGTTFELVVPAAKAEDRPPTIAGGEKRILVVDDRPELLAGFAQVCTDLGLECDTASSAVMGLNLLAAHAYGAVLIDLNMPGTSGVQMAKEARTSGVNAGTKLVAMTAGQEGVVGSELAVFDSVLEKPVGREQLASLMQMDPKRVEQPA